jgi:hypothetical protein
MISPTEEITIVASVERESRMTTSARCGRIPNLMTEITPEMRLRYLEEKQARRGLTDEEDLEMMELYVALGYLERGGLDPVTGEQQYLPINPGGLI